MAESIDMPFLNDLSFLLTVQLSCEVRGLIGGLGAVCLAFVVLRMYCCCKCSVTLPRGAMVWYAVCDSGIS